MSLLISPAYKQFVRELWLDEPFQRTVWGEKENYLTTMGGIHGSANSFHRKF